MVSDSQKLKADEIQALIKRDPKLAGELALLTNEAGEVNLADLPDSHPLKTQLMDVMQIDPQEL